LERIHLANAAPITPENRARLLVLSDPKKYRVRGKYALQLSKAWLRFGDLALARQWLETARTTGAAADDLKTFVVPAKAPLGDDGRDIRSFVVQSTVASSLTSLRAVLGTMLMGAVAPIVQAGYFRNAQAPLTAFGALSSPARLVLLAEQTADYERGDRERVIRLLKRYIAGTTAAMVVAVPVLWIIMPWFMGTVYGHAYRLHASDAARIVVVVAALQFVFGWTKTLPVTIGRPGLRILTHGLEALVFVPSIVIFAALWGATGGALALLVSTVAFCLAWSVLLYRLRPEIRRIDP